MANSPLMEQVEVDAGASATPEQPGLLAPDLQLLFLTWFTFFILLGILAKYAWKPILANLESREQTIRNSLEEADKVREEYLNLDHKRKQILTRADHEAKEVVDKSRHTAMNLAKVIDRKAKEEAQIMMTNAEREIEAELKNVEASLREKSADIAVELAGKIISKNLDSQGHRQLVDRLIDEI